MIVFPPEFVKVPDCPGYFWNRKEQVLYTIKVTGILRPMKKQKAFRGYVYGRTVDKPAGYQISEDGQRGFLSHQRLVDKFPRETHSLNGKLDTPVQFETVDMARAEVVDMDEAYFLSRCKNLLHSYLREFPEHNQGDDRVYQAAEILETLINSKVPTYKKRRK